MRLMVDARMAHHSGIGRYIRGLCRALAERDDVSISYLTSDPDPLEWEQDAPRFGYPAPIYSVREQLAGSTVMARHRRRHDLVHVPHYNAPWALPARSVITVHDLVHFRIAGVGARPRVWLARQVLERALYRAARVLVPSDATRRDLEALVPPVRGKVRVVPHGVDEMFRGGWQPPADQPPTILSLITSKPHKNLPMLLAAFRRVLAERPEVRLRLIGVDADQAALSGVPNVEGLGLVSDKALMEHYRSATLLAMPSRLEGFGFPALEAMACGTPVVASNCDALEELCGGAAASVPVSDPHPLAHVLLRVLGDRALQHELSERGRKRAGHFSWQRCTERTLEVYREALRGGRPRLERRASATDAPA